MRAGCRSVRDASRSSGRPAGRDRRRVADVPRAAPPQRPHLLRRAARLQHRHLAAADGDVAARLRPDRQGDRPRDHRRPAVPADALARGVGRCRRRPARQADAGDRSPSRCSRCRRSCSALRRCSPARAACAVVWGADVRRSACSTLREPGPARSRHRARRAARHRQRDVAEHRGDDRLADLRAGARRAARRPRSAAAGASSSTGCPSPPCSCRCCCSTATSCTRRRSAPRAGGRCATRCRSSATTGSCS